MALWKRLRGLLGRRGDSAPEKAEDVASSEAVAAADPAPSDSAESELRALAEPHRPVAPAAVRKAVDVLRQQGRELRAIELLGTALRARPDEIEILAALADVHVRRLDFDAAAPLLEKLLGSESHAVRAELLLGERAERQGDHETALYHYERVLARDLGHGQARVRTERLRRQLGHKAQVAQPTLVQPEGVATQGRYRLQRELGRGGAGVVYLAEDAHLGREVALKVYHPQVMRGDGPTQLAREAALPGRIGHPAIIFIFDVDAQLGAVAMEVLSGGSLKTWLRHEKKSPVQVLTMVEMVCDPLAAMHEAGIVHRDIKPANVMLRASGQPVLTDLGVALLPGERHQPGVGTPAYMAPEQRTEEAIDGRADVYAVGVMLAEMLGGYPGPTGRVGDLLDQCLCESPGGRPRNARELGRLIRATCAAVEAPGAFGADLERIAELVSPG